MEDNMTYFKVMLFLITILFTFNTVDANAATNKNAFAAKMFVSHARYVVNPQQYVQERIKLFEGFKPNKHKCSVSGVILQGYGRSIQNRKTPSHISVSTANAWLKEDIANCAEQLDMYLPWWRNLSTVRQTAMLDLTYNLGIFKLMQFKNFLAAMEHGKYHAAKDHLLSGKKGKGKSKYSQQVGIRAIEVANAIGTGIWEPMKEYS